MLNIVIPMAGKGSRFSDAGYEKPKPFIDVNGRPMIAHVMENLATVDARFILIAQHQHLLDEQSWVADLEARYNVVFVPIEHHTEGTACTVLHVRELINDNNSLLIANSDQIVDINIDDFIHDAERRELSGSILCFKEPSLDPKWSYAEETGVGGRVLRVKEKEAISDNATVGIYWFAKGESFVDSAIEMILRQDKVNGEYYTCPVYNYLIEKNESVGIYMMAKLLMHGIGTPADLDTYISSKFL